MDGEEVEKMKARGIFGSIAATGKYGDIMVAFPWKGLQVIRKLVYPAQPVTPLKTAQQGHMRNAQSEWHNALYTADDNTAWTLLASLRAYGQTGANQMTREYIRVARVPATWSRLRDIQDVAAAGTDREMRILGDAALVNVKCRFGTNIRFMNTIVVCVWDAPNLAWLCQIAPGTFASGERVYYQFYDSATTIDVALGISGIGQFDMP